MRNFKDLKYFAESQGFVVTSTTGGQHNAGSKHALGLAIDVRTRDKSNTQIEAFLIKCAALGVRVRDERIRPTHQKVWNGAHLHLEITSLTLAIVSEFQKRNNLLADGIVGPNTIAALNRLYS